MNRFTLRRVFAVALVALSSSVSLSGALAGPAQAHTSTRHHKVKHPIVHHNTHHHSTRPSASGIPQHNGGDGDSDNNGAPSDGDGNF